MPILIGDGRATVALLMLLAAMVSDLRHRLIPDWIAIGLSVLFLLPYLLSGRWPVIGEAIVAAAVVFFAGVLFFRFGWVGGGDVKLMSALALWAGPGGLLQFALLTSLVGGGVSLACLGWGIFRRWRDGGAPALGRIEVPYGVAIALGGAPLILATF